MSYLLEALRRAQNERNPAPVAPQVVQDEGQPLLRISLPRRSLMAALAGAAGMALLLGLAWLLWPESKPEPVSSSPAPMPAPAPASAVTADSPTLTSMDDLIESDTDAIDSSSVVEPEMLEASEPDPAPAPAVIEPAPAPDSVQVETIELDPAPPAYKTLREMPDDYRAAFPPLRIEVHVYNDDPAQRFVLMEGRRYKEGEALSSGPSIREITADGVVFSFRGKEVLVTVGS